MNVDSLPRTSVSDVTDAVNLLVQKILSDLKENAGGKAIGEQRLFFPNGIELISVVVKIGLADVEVTVAGEQGIKHAALERVRTTKDFRNAGMDVDDPVNRDDIFRGDQLVWYNHESKPVRIVFDINGCPLNTCDFTVPAMVKKSQPGTYLTVVRNTIDPGTYEFHRHGEKGFDGNPKIIIQ